MAIEPRTLLRRCLNLGLRRLGFETSRPRGLIEFVRSRNVDLVLDVGANVGQFGSELRHLGYRGRIVSFEPLKHAFATLAARAARDGNWTCHNLGLGNESGEATMNVSRDSVYSSMLQQTPAAADFDAGSSVERTEVIKVCRLDDLTATVPGERVFLKIDTQGFEQPVLQGARLYLPRVVGLQLELPLVHLYEHTWTVSDAIAYMAEAGFVLSQVAPVSFRIEDPVSLLEIDAVFRRLDAGDVRPDQVPAADPAIRQTKPGYQPQH
jgi:FkbM family methyltransferase